MARTAKPWKYEGTRGKRKAGYYAWVRGRLEFLDTTEREANRVLKQLVGKAGTKPARSGSVAELMDNFLEFIQRRADRTHEWYQRHLQSFLDSIPKSLQLDDLRTHHIQKWIDSHDWSDGTKHGAWRAVHRCFRWAVRQGHMDRNPAESVEKPSPTRRDNPVTEDHYRKMVDGTRDQAWQDVLVFSWETGARPQETRKIEARHFDGTRIVFPEKESKGKKFSRVIYVTHVALEIVKRLTKNHPKGPIFLNTDGAPWTMYSTNCRFLRWKKKLDVKYCLYDFRHAWQNRLLKAGVDPMTLAVLAGHVDPSTFARWYQHLSRDSEYLQNALLKGSTRVDASGPASEPSAA